jgi:hypothetical protein
MCSFPFRQKFLGYTAGDVTIYKFPKKTEKYLLEIQTETLKKSFLN